MGLFDFMKKPRTDVPMATGKSSDSESRERTSVFKGDLALLNDNSTQKKSETVYVYPVNDSQTIENKDSKDSVVFMSFAPIKKGCWICHECGTSNDEGLNGCVVCGLRK